MANHEVYVVQGKTLDNIAGTMRAVLGVDKDAPIRFDEVASSDKTEQINADIETQTDLIAQIQTALEGKAAGSGGTALSNAVYEVKEYNDNGYIKALSYKIPSNLPQDTIPNYAMRADATSLLTKSIEEIIIANNPTKVGQYAFAGLSGLKKVSCYDGLITIGRGAFNSTALSYNYLPPNIETIDADAFAQCQNFVFTEIPASVKTIGLDVFYSNTRLTEIRFKGTPVSLHGRTFQNCATIKNIYVPWAEGAVANAPWGATNATIHYNSEV